LRLRARFSSALARAELVQFMLRALGAGKEVSR